MPGQRNGISAACLQVESLVLRLEAPGGKARATLKAAGCPFHAAGRQQPRSLRAGRRLLGPPPPGYPGEADADSEVEMELEVKYVRCAMTDHRGGLFSPTLAQQR